MRDDNKYMTINLRDEMTAPPLAPKPPIPEEYKLVPLNDDELETIIDGINTWMEDYKRGGKVWMSATELINKLEGFRTPDTGDGQSIPERKTE